MHHRAKCYQNQLNCSDCTDTVVRDTVIKVVAVRHLGFIGHVLGPVMMTTWWFLSPCKIWLESVQ